MKLEIAAQGPFPVGCPYCAAVGCVGLSRACAGYAGPARPWLWRGRHLAGGLGLAARARPLSASAAVGREVRPLVSSGAGAVGDPAGAPGGTVWRGCSGRLVTGNLAVLPKPGPEPPEVPVDPRRVRLPQPRVHRGPENSGCLSVVILGHSLLDLEDLTT